MGRETVVITGAAGRVARAIAPSLRKAFQLRLVDLVDVEVEGDDTAVRCDVRDIAALTAACSRAHAVVHLAAEPDEADFRSRLLPKNLDGAWSTFEAASRASVRRFVFASSIQTVDGYPASDYISPERPPRPVSLYGCTKIFGEALGRLFAETRGLGVACLRIGAVTQATTPRLASDDRFRGLWCDPRDLASLIEAAIRSEIPFATVIAVSRPGMSRFDTSNPYGWVPLCESVPPSNGAA